MKRSKIENECSSRGNGGFSQNNFLMNRTGSISSKIAGLDTAGTSKESRFRSTFNKS